MIKEINKNLEDEDFMQIYHTQPETMKKVKSQDSLGSEEFDKEVKKLIVRYENEGIPDLMTIKHSPTRLDVIGRAKSEQ